VVVELVLLLRLLDQVQQLLLERVRLQTEVDNVEASHDLLREFHLTRVVDQEDLEVGVLHEFGVVEEDVCGLLVGLFFEGLLLENVVQYGVDIAVLVVHYHGFSVNYRLLDLCQPFLPAGLIEHLVRLDVELVCQPVGRLLLGVDDLTGAFA